MKLIEPLSRIAFCSILSLLTLEGIASGNPVSKSSINHQGIGSSELIAGLKEALNKGIAKAADTLGRPSGYLTNALVKIAFPPEAQQVADKIRKVGGNEGKKLVDGLVEKMNHAAEAAAANPETKQIFLNAIHNLNIQNGLQILKGDSMAATAYLKGQTQQPLTVLFSPVIRKAMDEAGVQNAWLQVTNLYNTLNTFAFHKPKIPTDISQYVTGRALDGLFLMVGKEEAAIRKNPVKQTTTLLKKVFGGLLK